MNLGKCWEEGGSQGASRVGVMRSDPASTFAGLYKPCPCPSPCLELIPDVAGSSLTKELLPQHTLL